MQLEKHHLIPLSLFGIDRQCNIVLIPKWQHRVIHTCMDIPYRKYSDLWREYRKHHNHKIALDDQALSDRLKMQTAYLSGFNKLPRASQFLHLDKMVQTIHYYQPDYDVKLNGHMLNDWKKLLKIYSKLFLSQLA